MLKFPNVSPHPWEPDKTLVGGGGSGEAKVILRWTSILSRGRDPSYVRHSLATRVVNTLLLLQSIGTIINQLNVSLVHPRSGKAFACGRCPLTRDFSCRVETQSEFKLNLMEVFGLDSGRLTEIKFDTRSVRSRRFECILT